MARKEAAPPARSHDDRGTSYHASLGLLAFLAACLTALVLVTLQFSSLSPLLHSLRDGSAAPSSAQIKQLAPIVGAPVLAALLAYLLGGQIIRLARVQTYRRRLHRYLAQWLRTYAPLSALGISPTITRASTTDQHSSARQARLADLISDGQRAMLDGKEASGKTAALYALAYELTRRRALLSQWTGRAPLPVLVTLDPEMDPASGDEDHMLARIRESLRLFGTSGLAARAPTLIKRGRLALLCDGLDDLPQAHQMRLRRALRACVQVSRKRRATAVIAACSIRTEGAPKELRIDLADWQRVHVEPLSDTQIREAMRKSRRERNLSDDSLAELLSPSLASPAALAALAALLSTQPTGASQLPARADLWRRYTEHAFSASNPTNPTDSPANAITLLGAIAAGLRATAQHAVPIAPTGSFGRTLAEWLEQADPPMPTEVTESIAPLLGPEALQAASQRALTAGVLLQDPAKRHVRFANRVLEAAFAARWLAATDNGLGRLRPELLQSEWILPILLWAGAAQHPEDVTVRLLRLLDTPESASVRAGFASQDEYRMAVLALALGTACESLAPVLARDALEQRLSADTIALAEEQLRDVMDRVLRHLESPEQQDAMRMALSTVVEAGGREVVQNLRYLATHARIQRLVRAQLVLVLGLMTSDDALAVIVSLLDEPDALIRQAVTRALMLAGARALPALREALSSPSERVRARAAETLAQFGDTAVDTAIAGLAGQQPEQRAAAAHTLGALQAARGAAALSDRLAHDTADSVRVAAALALGQIATAQAIEALQREAGATSATVRAAVAQALGTAHDPAALNTLLKLLDDSQPRVRAAAAAALGLLGDERALPALREHRDDQDQWTQNAVVFALRRLGS